MTKSWEESKPPVWDRLLAVCAGCGRVVPNDATQIVDGIHRRILVNSSDRVVSDEPCGEVAVYRFDRTLAPNPTAKAPATRDPAEGGPS